VERTYKLIREQWVPQTIEAAFAFFSRPENLQAITPEWLDFRITNAEDHLRTGSLIRYRLRWHGIPLRWTTAITDWNPPHSFVDTQLSGPYALWQHEHRLMSENQGTRIRDEVTHALPLGIAGHITHRLLVRRDVEAIFDFRQRRLRELLGE
jgi:ligand-binding SRPBCC domain-containing protein